MNFTYIPYYMCTLVYYVILFPEMQIFLKPRENVSYKN